MKHTTFIVWVRRNAEGSTHSVLSPFGVDNVGFITQSGACYFKTNEVGGFATVYTDYQTWHCVTFRVNGSSSADIYKDGASIVSFDPIDSVTTGTGLLLGYITGTAVGGDYDFAELIQYATALSDADRAIVEAYLIAKWGL